VADISPPLHQPSSDPFADFLTAAPLATASSQPAAMAASADGSEIFGSAPAAAAGQANTSTKDAIMALYGSSATAPAAGPYCLPPAGV